LAENCHVTFFLPIKTLKFQCRVNYSGFFYRIWPSLIFDINAIPPPTEELCNIVIVLTIQQIKNNFKPK